MYVHTYMCRACRVSGGPALFARGPPLSSRPYWPTVHPVSQAHEPPPTPDLRLGAHGHVLPGRPASRCSLSRSRTLEAEFVPPRGLTVRASVVCTAPLCMPDSNSDAAQVDGAEPWHLHELGGDVPFGVRGRAPWACRDRFTSRPRAVSRPHSDDL